MPDDRISDHIATGLSPGERGVMKSVMLALPRTKRDNVVYFDRKGALHANRPSIMQIARSQPWRRDALPGTTRGGSRSAMPYACTSPPASATTGVFRAVYSRCNTPYASSDVYLPCKSNGDIFLNYPGNEAAYVYEGGFGRSGDAIDAGLQHSWTHDTWALFMNGDHGWASVNPNFQCNQTVMLEFYPASDTLLAVDVTGYVGYGRYATYTEAYAVASGAGWSPRCDGCVVKRVTSLAQSGSARLGSVDGSYVGLDRSFRPSIRWSNANVGFWNGRRPAQFTVHSWTESFTGGYRNFPDDAGKIRVQSAAGDEIDGLLLQ